MPVYALQLLIPAVVLNPGQIASFLGRGDNSVLPPPQNRLIMVTIYENTFTYSRFGYGLALSWFMFIAIMIITLILLRTSNRWVYYEVDVNRS